MDSSLLRLTLSRDYADPDVCSGIVLIGMGFWFHCKAHPENKVDPGCKCRHDLEDFQRPPLVGLQGGLYWFVEVGIPERCWFGCPMDHNFAMNRLEKVFSLDDDQMLMSMDVGLWMMMSISPKTDEVDGSPSLLDIVGIG